MAARLLRDGPTVRFAVCVIFAGIFYIFPSPGVVALMLSMALISSVKQLDSGEISIALSLLILIQAVYSLLAFVVYWFALNPIHWTPVRGDVVEDTGALVVTFGAAQFLFILTAALRNRMNEGQSFSRRNNALTRFALLIFIIIASLIINPGRDFMLGDYQGHDAHYPGFLPFLFVAATGCWVLLHNNYDLKFFLVLNLIVAWWLLNGNRSEVLIIFLLGNYLFIRKFWSAGNAARLSLFAAGAIATFLIFSFVGYFRVHGAAALGNLDIVRLLTYLVEGDRLQVQTFGSAIYSAMAAVDYARESGLLYGETIAGQFLNTLPSFVPVPWQRYDDIAERLHHYQILGGLGFLGEGFVNFGVIGPSIMAYALTLVLVSLRAGASISFFSSWFLLTLILYCQRFILYGFVYFYNTVVFFLVIFILQQLLLRRGRPSAEGVS